MFFRARFPVIAGIAIVCVVLLSSVVLAQLPDPGDYTDDYLSYLPLVNCDYDPTWQWGQVVTPTLSPSPSTSSDNQPLLAIDRAGQVHILWNPTTSPKFVYHSYLTSSGWTTPTAVATSLGYSTVLFPPVIAPDGRIHLLWLNELTYSDPYRLLYSVFSQGSWSPEEEVYCSDTKISLQGMVHLDNDGDLHATVLDSNWLSTKVYHIVRSGAGWGSPVEIEKPDYVNWVWPDRWGGIHFYGNDYQDPPTLYYSYWRDGDFLRLGYNAGNVRVSSRETQLDGHNNLHIFWTGAVPIPGGQVTGLSHQCLTSDLTASDIEVLSGSNSVDRVSKGASYNGWTTLAWEEQSEESSWLRIVVWDGCSEMYNQSMLLEKSWTVLSAAVSDDPGKVCVLVRVIGEYEYPYRVLCADILR